MKKISAADRRGYNDLIYRTVLYVQCRKERSVIILANIRPRGSAMIMSSADTSQGAESVSDISPIL